jgi:hypothetical protein
MAKRPILLLVDVEPDERHCTAGDGWRGTRLVLEELERARALWRRITKEEVALNWFLRSDPQIETTWRCRNQIEIVFPRFVRHLRQGADFAGIHPHFWRWNPSQQRWHNDFAGAEWKEKCLRNAIDGFVQMLGYRPLASRFGDRWIDQTLVDLLLREGIRYDLTLEPGAPARRLFDDTGSALPELPHEPLHPFRPQSTNFLQPRPAGTPGPDLWMIPVSMTPPAWGLVRNVPPLRRFRRTCNLVLWPRLMQRFVASELASESKEPLVLVMRSGDLANPRYLSNFMAMIDLISKHPGLPGCRFTTVPDALAGRAEPVNCAGPCAAEQLPTRRHADHVVSMRRLHGAQDPA